MIGQAANPIYIIYSDDLDDSFKYTSGIGLLKLSSVISDDVLSVPVHGVVVSGEDERVLAEKWVVERSLDIDVVDLSLGCTPEEAVRLILVGQIGRGEISRSELMREMISLENDRDLLERRILQIQRFMQAAAVDDTVTVFSSLRTRPEAHLTLNQQGVWVDSTKVGVNTGFHCRMPVSLKEISCIRFENVTCDLSQGRLTFSLHRPEDPTTIVSWTLQAEDLRPDHTIMLFVPSSLTVETVDVDLFVAMEDLDLDEQVMFPLCPPKADETSHIYFGENAGIPNPLCFEISKGLPFVRSTPYSGCIHPDAFHSATDLNLQKQILYSAEQVWPKKTFPHELVGEKTYRSTGLLVHPVMGDTTCAHIDLNGHLPGKPEKILIHAINDSAKNQGILFSAFISDSELHGHAIKKRIRQIEDWMMVSPDSQAAFSIGWHGAGGHLYLASALEKGVSNQYGWLLVNNIRFVYPQ